MTRTGVILLLVVVLLTGTGAFVFYHGKASASPASEVLSCKSTEAEQCPSQDFLRGFSRWQDLRTSLASSNGAESVDTRERQSDEYAGLTNRLAGMMPKGTQFDEIKRRFVALPSAAAQTPAQAVGAVPVPTIPNGPAGAAAAAGKK